MSPSWRDRYVGVLAPEGVALVRRRRGWRTAYDLKLDSPCAAPTPAAAVQAFAALLEAPEVGPGDLVLVLSNHFVRYLLVPWRDEVGTPAELEAYARICCEQVYGGDCTGRVLRISPERAGCPRLAALVEGDFLALLEKALAASRLRLAAVAPYLAAAYNRLGRELPPRDFLFVVAEPSRTCLLAAAGGRWSAVRAGGGEDSPEALAGFIERECRLLGLEPEAMPPLFVHAPRRAKLELRECNGSRPASLALPIPPSLAAGADPLLAMAMAAP